MSERFKVDLRGVIDLAANHLYTTPEVFVRELVQNAVDAITARARVEPGHAGAVRLELTPGSGGGPSTIAVTDNDVGLTLPEVHEFLSTVGGSSKREDAEAAAERIERGGRVPGKVRDRAPLVLHRHRRDRGGDAVGAGRGVAGGGVARAGGRELRGAGAGGVAGARRDQRLPHVQARCGGVLRAGPARGPGPEVRRDAPDADRGRVRGG
jgi:hypothetical protein